MAASSLLSFAEKEIVLASNCAKTLEEKVRHVEHIDISSLYSDELLIQKFFFRPTPLSFRQVVQHVQLHVA